MKQTRLLILVIFIAGFANSFAVNRYWVAAGSANWADASSWSATSGGSSGATAPTTGDDVFFESGSAITVTLGAAVTVNSITFTSRNVTFAGAFSITTTNMTVDNSQLVFVNTVNINSSLVFSGTSTTPRIKHMTTGNFQLGNGGAFTLTGNSATNYFEGTTSSSFRYNTTSALTVFFKSNTTLAGIYVYNGLITIGNNLTTVRINMPNTSLNNQELIIGTNVTYTLTTGGTSGFASETNGGTVNASASGSKFVINSTSSTVLDGTKRIFKTGVIINNLEFNSSGNTLNLFESIRVRNITKTAGTIATTALKTITVEAGGAITGAGTIGTDIINETATTRYWVGGAAGSWFNAASWGTSSGNTSTPRIPAYGDNVVFDNSTGNENPTVTLTDHVTSADINFTNSNVTFAGADSIKTNSMTVNSSQVQFIDHVRVNSSLTFSGTDPRITQQSTTSGRAFIFGNGGAFTLIGNSATNYFTGNTNAYYTFNTTSPLTVYFNPTTTTAGAIVVTKGLITLGNDIKTNRLTLNALNSHELILGENVTFTMLGGGTSNIVNTALAGVVNASATGSKFVIGSTAPTFLATSGRIFKDATTINHLEMNSNGQTFIPGFPLTVKSLTLTAGSINNTTNNITIPSGGNLVVGAGTTTAALNASLPSVPTIGTATAGNAQASVAFTAPANGGSLITGYTVTPYIGETAGTPVTQNANPVVVTGLTNGTAYTFSVKANNGVGASAESTATNPAVTPDATAHIITVTTGTNASSLGLTPVSDVVIAKDALLTINQSTTLNSLTVAAGGMVTNASTLNGSTLTINSNATDGTGTFIDNGTTTFTGTTSVNQSFQHQGALRSWYVSSPVASFAPTGMSTIKYFDESLNNALPADNWTGTTTMLAKKGYMVTPALAVNNLSFEGALNNGNQSISITRRAGTENKPGFNLIGNPYLSYLDWSAVCAYTTDEGATHPNQDIMPTTTMWYRTKARGSWEFVTVNGAGVSSPVNVVTKYIPPMQAFWVRSGNATGTLELTNDMRFHTDAVDNPNPNLLKAPAAKNSEMTLVRLQVSNGVNTDETVIYFSDNAQNGFDKLDAPKMSNENVAIPEIYTTLGTEQIVINGMKTIPLDTPIGLGFVAGNATAFSLTANEVTNLPNSLSLILKDNVTKTETDLTDGTSTYQFSPAVSSSDRFSLIFRTPGAVTGLENMQDNSILVYNNAPQQLTVICNDLINAGSVVSVYNAIGQKLMSQKLTGTSMQIDGTFTQGVYVVKVNNTTRKVIVN